MGLVYKIERPLEAINLDDNENIKFIISQEITEEDFNKLNQLITEAKAIIKEEITDFAKVTFLEESTNKEKMNFIVGRAYKNHELIGYSIGYCDLENLTEFYLDVVYINSSNRKGGIGLQLALNMINAISEKESIEKIIMITQSDNEGAKRLIEKINKAANNT